MNLQVLVDRDLCKGFENIPVIIESKTSKVEYPAFQVKVWSPSENIPGPGCNIDPSECSLPGCSCHSHSCLTESCSCLQRYGRTYDSHGRLPAQESTDRGYCRPVFECNALCGCSEACCNRVVQRGLGVRLGVYPTQRRGWGVKALEAIPRGTFVCEYAGEVIGREEARRRQLAQGPEDNNYIIAVREHAGQGPVSETFVDPAVVGNVGRFLNHSCQPNLVMVPVRVHSLVPRLALFAGNDIAAQEELTFDYSGCYGNKTAVGRQTLVCSDSGAEGSSTATGAPHRKPCHCGAFNCARFLPLDNSVLSS